MKITVTIQGVTPLLMHRFTDENALETEHGTRPISKGEKGTPREQAEPKRYCDKEDNLYIPGPNINSCIVAAGKFHKLGKVKVTTLKSSLVPAGLIVEDITCDLGTKEFEVDSRRVVNPSTGGAFMCHRPRLDVWGFTFHLDVDDEMFSERFVRILIDDAGRKIGLGDFRPDRKGPFGRFVVKKWNVEISKKAA